MRTFLFAFLAWMVISCNSSADKTNVAKNDSTGKISTTSGIIDIKPVKLTEGQIPPQLKFRGKVEEAWQWIDKLGDNILITSFVEPYRPNKLNEDEKTAELHVFHFLKKDTAYKLLWKIADGEQKCPFDITLGFIDAVITDLDKNGIAETTVQYESVCRSDVSPSRMKIVMHEDTMKYALRGVRWLYGAVAPAKFEVTEKDVNLEKLPKVKDEWEGYIRSFGRYESEKEFSKAPPEFLTYARSQWLKHAVESLEH